MPFYRIVYRILWSNFAWKRIWIIGLILDRRWYIWVERQIKLLASPQLLYNKMKDSAGLKTPLLIEKWNSKQHVEGGLFFIYKYWTSHLKIDFVMFLTKMNILSSTKCYIYRTSYEFLFFGISMAINCLMKMKYCVIL